MTQAGMSPQPPISFPSFTCSSECSNLGGTSGSSCAEGFGVCCSCKPLIDDAIFHTYISLLKNNLKTCLILLVELTCGGSSSQNATYIINTSPTASCTYSICPSSTGICRIRYKFITRQYNNINIFYKN